MRRVARCSWLSLWLALGAGCKAPTAANDTDANTVSDTSSPATADTDQVEDAVFTLLVMPDVQYLTLEPEPIPMLQEMMQWVLDNQRELDIAMVLQEGDLTHNNTTPEWQEADRSFSMIEGVVPYVVCVGNHDMDGGDTSQFNTWFGLDRLRQQPTFLSSASRQQADNHAHSFRAGGLDWLVLSLTYNPSPEAVSWGASVVADHPEMSVIVLTHAYLTPSGETGAEGRDVQARIVDPYPNVRLVLNGHYLPVGASRRRRARPDGSEVIEAFANYQDLPLAGWGRMRQLRIDTAQGTLQVKSCSAYDACSDDPGDSFGYQDFSWAASQR